MKTKRPHRPHRKLALVAVLLTIALAACSGVIQLGSNSGSTSGTTGGGATTTSASTTSGPGGGAVSTTSGLGGSGGAPSTTTASPGSGGSGGASTSSSSSGDPTVSTSPASSFEYDTHLAVATNGAVFVTWVGVPSSGTPFIGYAVSSDGGMTFPVQGTVPTPGGRSADHPTLAADAQDNVYLAWLGYVAGANGTRTDSHVYVAAATAGATAFGAAVEASEPMGFDYANPWITVTPMGSPLVTFQRSGTVDLGIVAARSGDMGMTWATSVVATDVNLLNDRDMPDPCASAITGRVFVTYFSNDPAAGPSIGIGWSDDDGVTWIDPVEAPLINPSDVDPAGSLPKCVAVESAIRVIYGVTNGPTNPNPAALPKISSVYYSASVDDGATFDVGNNKLLNVSDNGPVANLQLIGDAAGGFDLTYYDEAAYIWKRVPNGADFNVLGAFPPMTIDGALTAELSRTTPTRLGDYTGLAATATTLFTSYVDNSSGASHVRVHVAPLQ